jgi:putative cell wall-binding protein
VKRIASVIALLVAVIVTMTLGTTTGPVHGQAPKPVNRVAGADRIGTAVEVSRIFFPARPGATVLLATAGSFPDALAAGALAARRDASLLLTPPGSLPQAVHDELARLGASEVILLGGTAAISASVEQQIRDHPTGPTVTRLAGANRYETGAAVARAAGAPAGQVTVANGESFADALSSGALAAVPDRLPVVLVTRDRVHPATAEVLADLAPTHAYVVGGTAAVSEATAEAVRGQTGGLDRLAGANRFDTSQRVAEVALERVDATPRPLVVATGGNFPDALAAGALAARVSGMLLLVPGNGLSPSVDAFIRAHHQRFSEAIVVGGPAAVSPGALEQIGQAINAIQAPPSAPACVNINTAGFDDLRQIIHIDADRAQQIIDLRPFGSVDELTRVNGIGPARLQDIKDQGLACV